MRRLVSARKALAFSICLFAAALPLSIAGANIGWGLILASLLACRLCAAAIPYGARASAIEKPLWFFLAAAVIADAFGVDPARSFSYLNQDFHKVWIYTLLAVALTAFSTERAETKSITVLACLAAGFAVASAVGIFQALQITPDMQPWDRPRAHAFVHPATYGEQICVALIGSLCFLWRARTEKRPPRFRNAAIALSLLTAAALLMSNTRGAVLAFLAGTFAVAMVLPTLRKRLWLIVPIALLVLLVMESDRADRSLIVDAMQRDYTDRTDSRVTGQFMRLRFWDAALRIGRDHLWTGVGHNNFRTVLPDYLRIQMEDRSASWGTAHNLYLHHFAERGLLGLGALLVFLGAFWGRALQRARENANAWNLWAFGTATAFLVMNLTEVALQVEIVWMLTFFVWIWAEVLHRGGTRGA